MPGDRLIDQPANCHWYHSYAYHDIGREPWLSTMLEQRLDPYPEWCYYNHVPEGQLGYRHHVKDGYMRAEAHVRGAYGKPFDQSGAEEAHQKAAQDRAEAESQEALRKLIESYNQQPQQPRPVQTAAAYSSGNFAYPSSSRHASTPLRTSYTGVADQTKSSTQNSYSQGSTAQRASTTSYNVSSRDLDRTPYVGGSGSQSASSSSEDGGVAPVPSTQTQASPQKTKSSSRSANPMTITTKSGATTTLTNTSAEAYTGQADGADGQENLQDPSSHSGSASELSQESLETPWSD